MRSMLFASAFALVCGVPLAAGAQSPAETYDLPCSAHAHQGLYPALERLVPAEASPDLKRKVRGVVVRTLTWKPGELVKVCFRSGTIAARQRVIRHASEWMRFANVKLEFGDPSSPRSCQGDQTEAIKVDFLESGPKAGYWSALGTLSRKSEHSLNLAFLGNDRLPVDKIGTMMPEAEARRLILHEFGHALGLLHEHQSPRAACQDEYYEEAVLAYGALRGWPKEQTIRNFQQFNETEELNATSVDRRSIMHYSLPPWLFKTGQKSACYVPVNFEISEGDRAFMQRVYPRDGNFSAPRPMAAAPSGQLVRGAGGGPVQKLVDEYAAALKGAGLDQARIDALVAEFRKAQQP